MYFLVPKKPLRLVYGTFYLAPQGHFLRAPSVMIFTNSSIIVVVKNSMGCKADPFFSGFLPSVVCQMKSLHGMAIFKMLFLS